MQMFMVVSAFLAMTGLARAGAMLKVGDTFPTWELVDQTGAKVASTNFAGKTYLLYFFPKAMTPGCTKEGCAIRDHFAEFQKAGIDVVGVSFDDPKDNAEFIKKENFPFRLLSDQEHKLAAAVGAADSPTRAYAKRISYLVGPDGKVLVAYDNVDPSKHATQVLTDAGQLKPGTK